MALPTPDVTVTDLALLDFAGLRFNRSGGRDEAIRERFDCSPFRYEQRLNALIDRPDIYMVRPVLVKRLLRLRDQRRSDRSRQTA